MMIGKNLLLCTALILVVIVIFRMVSISAAADPNVKKDIKVESVPDARSSDPSKTVVKNPHGFLEYDGTGYRVVTRESKPDKASQVRLKPVTSKEHGTVYILEVIDEKEKPAEAAQNRRSRAPVLPLKG